MYSKGGNAKYKAIIKDEIDQRVEIIIKKNILINQIERWSPFKSSGLHLLSIYLVYI